MEQALEIIGTLVGLIYLWLEYRASVYLWIASIIMPAIYLFVYYNAGLYADFAINIYYLGIAVYGWIWWKYGTLHATRRRQEQLPITHMPLRHLLPLMVVFAVTFVVMAQVLIHFTNSNVPWWDSFTTALSIVAIWMLARKYVEQWWVWVGVDAVSTGLYICKDLYFTATLYGLYTIIAIFGYFKWKKMMEKVDA